MSEENLSSASGAIENSAPPSPSLGSEPAASGAAGEPSSALSPGFKSGLEVRLEALEAQMEELIAGGISGGGRALNALEERLSELEHAVASHAGALLSQSGHDGLAKLKAWFDKFIDRNPPAASGG